MKTITKILGIVCIICALFAILNTATASTESQKYTSIYLYGQDQEISKFCKYSDIKLIDSTPKDKSDKEHPSKESVMDFIHGANVQNDNYAETMFQASKNDNPNRPCDLWETKDGIKFVSFYYYPDSGSDYGYNGAGCSGGNCGKSAVGENTAKMCTGPDCGDKDEKETSDDKKDSGYSFWGSDDKKEKESSDDDKKSSWGGYEPQSKKEESTSVKEDDNKESSSDKKFETPDENTFTMSNKEKIKSVIHYGKAAGFDDDELQFLEMCLTFYWGY